MSNQSGGTSPWVWVGVGCGGLLLVGLCVGGGAAFWMMRAVPDHVSGPVAQQGTPSWPTATDPGVPVAVPTQPPALPTAPRPSDTSPRAVTASVTNVTGNPGVAPGNECVFLVEMHDQADAPGGYWCRANVMCGLTLLYGGGTAGYFPCTVFDNPRGVVGQDM